MRIQDEIVQITTTFVEQPVTRTGFGTMLLLSDTPAALQRVKSYGTVNEMLEDGFVDGSPEVVAANLYFGQELKPSLIHIGRRRADTIEVNIDAAVNGEVYTLLVDNEEVTYTAGPSDTTSDISGELTTLIQALGGNVTASDSLGALDVTAVDSDVIFGLSIVSGSMSFSTIAWNDTVTAGLGLILDENSNFYGIATTSRDQNDVLDINTFANNNDKIFGYASSDADILGSGDTDIAAQLQTLDAARTFGLYHPDAATTYPEAAWFGNLLPRDPGSATWAFKTLTGIPFYTLSSAETTNAQGKNINLYVSVGGQGATYGGVMASGRFIDIRVGIDWLEQRVKERVQGLFLSVGKVPYTNAGRDLILNVIRAQFDEAVERDVIALGYSVTAPNVLNVPAVDRENRILRNVEATARLAGAIHEVRIEFILNF